MQEIRHDGAEILTEAPSMAELMAAMENPSNKEVRLIPNIDEPKQFYTVKKRGKWVVRKR